MTGYVGPPSIQTFGLVNNIMLGALLFKLCDQSRIRQRKEDHTLKRRNKKGENDDNDEVEKSNSKTKAIRVETGIILNNLKQSFSFFLPLSPEIVTLGSCLLSIGFLSIGFILNDKKKEQNIIEISSVPVGIYVIATMGKLCWTYNNHHRDTKQQSSHKTSYRTTTTFTNQKSKKKNLSLFQLWKISCISLILVLSGIGIELSICNDESKSLSVKSSDSTLTSISQILFWRLYHSIFLHSMIPILYYCISECAFRLVDIIIDWEYGAIVVSTRTTYKIRSKFC